eukprot:2324708-Pleurochrysis_carterae.AAC.1
MLIMLTATDSLLEMQRRFVRRQGAIWHLHAWQEYTIFECYDMLQLAQCLTGSTFVVAGCFMLK